MEIFGLTPTAPPVQTYAATTLDDVKAVLYRADAAAHAGRWVALLVTYEAAPAFDRAMRVHRDPSPTLPLAWAAEFVTMQPVPRVLTRPAETAWPNWQPSIDGGDFRRRVVEAQRQIADGNTYQVNLTFPLRGDAPRDPDAWFAQLHAIQPASFTAMLEIGDATVLSLSPELFFEIDSGVIRTRPMKGTLPRGRWRAEDEALARTLAASPKAQAENVMIVDLLRNDLGRIAVTGTVTVPHRFAVERYPTLWQMTSTVEARLRDGTTLAEVFAALFPCGSVTGAPKIATMSVIAELESTPRGLYTGTIGLLRPGGGATFSVAIRTIVVDRQRGTATLGVGAGITADSVPEDEYDECLLKGAFASSASRPLAEPFELIETIRLENGSIVRLQRHLRRCRDSAAYFGFEWNETAVSAAIAAAAAANAHGVWRLRLTVDRHGTPAVTCTPHEETAARAWHVAFASAPVDEHDPFLCNKTTNRKAYDVARRGRPDVDDVLLWNQRGELTESTIANVVVEIDGVRYTPPVDCGLLPGTLREELVEAGAVRERVITRGEVVRARRLWLINSLRGWIDATLVR